MFNLFLGDRATGKTCELFLKSYEERIPILCIDKQRANHYYKAAYEFFNEKYPAYAFNFKDNFPYPLTLNDLKGSSVKSVLIDEFDYFIDYLIKRESCRDIKIAAATLSAESGIFFEKTKNNNYFKVHFNSKDLNLSKLSTAHRKITKVENLRKKELDLQNELNKVRSQINNLEKENF